MHSLRDLKGVGEKTEKLFGKMGVHSQEDLLFYFPRTYEFFGSPVALSDIVPDQINAAEAVIRKTPSVRRYDSQSVTIAELYDGETSVQAVWFHMPYLRTKLRPGMRLVFRGMVKAKGKRMVMEHPRIYTPAGYAEVENRYQPVYALTSGISNQTVQKTIRACLVSGLTPGEYMPAEILVKYGLCSIQEAVTQAHFPESGEKLMTARKRLIFDEFFLFLLGVTMLRRENDVTASMFPMKRGTLADRAVDALPYELTDGQKRIFEQIVSDLTGGRLMHRMIQGDVGSGKTILAFLSMILLYDNGYQSALMVPTEVLAGQHYRALQSLLEGIGLDPELAVLLTGSCTAKEKKEIYRRVESGEAAMIVGTHALIQEKVRYRNLALAVTDEQHRFGVRQRERLEQKGGAPNVLVMSATPIPRTLALILYGDLDISELHEMPARRQRIKNAVVDTSYRPSAYRFIQKEVAAGHQAYVICPLVEESEEIDAENVTDYSRKLQKVFGEEVRVGTLHGKMKPAEKNRIMTEFAEQKIDVLVSTTVIEVGVNVPNATVMMVENAERFGLAQLHQLRGRVGRGEDQSYCIFIQGNGSKTISHRLEILKKSNDGFAIAEEDLKLRGPGDLFGVRQSGIAVFEMGDIYRDRDILVEANEAAHSILSEDPTLESMENIALKRRLERYMKQQNDYNPL